VGLRRPRRRGRPVLRLEERLVGDAKHTARLGIPTYGFAPLRLKPGDGFLELAHADDERVPIDGLKWGFGVLADAVARFCG